MNKRLSDMDGSLDGYTEVQEMMQDESADQFDHDNFYPFVGGGEVIPSVAVNAMQNVGPTFQDGEQYLPADGGDRYAEFDRLPSFQDDHSDFLGIGSGKLKAKMAANKAKRQSRRDERQSNRTAKKQAKAEEIRSRANLNNSLTTEKQSDIEAAQALNRIASQPDNSENSGTEDGADPNKKMSTGTIVLIVGGSAIGLALIGFLIYKSTKKK